MHRSTKECAHYASAITSGLLYFCTIAAAEWFVPELHRIVFESGYLPGIVQEMIRDLFWIIFALICVAFLFGWMSCILEEPPGERMRAARAALPAILGWASFVYALWAFAGIRHMILGHGWGALEVTAGCWCAVIARLEIRRIEREALRQQPLVSTVIDFKTRRKAF